MKKIRLIVIHSTAGKFKNDLKTLMGYNSEVSSHYLINTDGKIYQLVDENKRANHAKFLNNISIGIEITDNGKTKLDDYLTGEQYISVLRLVNNIADRYNIPKEYINFSEGLSNAGKRSYILNDKNVKGIVFHRDVSTVDKVDPTGFDKEMFMYDLRYTNTNINFLMVDDKDKIKSLKTILSFEKEAKIERENYRKSLIDFDFKIDNPNRRNIEESDKI